MMLRLFLVSLISALCSSCNAETVDSKANDSLVISVLFFSESISNGNVEKFKESTNSNGIYLVRKFTSGNLGGRGEELSRMVPLSSMNKEMEFSIEGQTPFNIKILFPGIPVPEYKKLPQYPLSADVCDLAFDQWEAPLKRAVAPLRESAEGIPIILTASTKCWVYTEAQVIDGVLVGGFAVFKYNSGKSSLVSIIELL